MDRVRFVGQKDEDLEKMLDLKRRGDQQLTSQQLKEISDELAARRFDREHKQEELQLSDKSWNEKLQEKQQQEARRQSRIEREQMLADRAKIERANPVEREKGSNQHETERNFEADRPDGRSHDRGRERGFGYER